jgi:hypothetical protein
MDDAFRIVAAQMPRTRRLSPFATRVIAVLTVFVLATVAFGMFIAGQQRAADARRAISAAEQRAARDSDARAAAQQAMASPTLLAPSRDGVASLLDTHARTAAADALATAEGLAAATSLDRLFPPALSAANPDLVFVDGPSTAPSVVSVYAGAAGWAAAVRGSGRSCYWVALSDGGRARFGTGSACTGMAALAADRPSW